MVGWGFKDLMDRDSRWNELAHCPALPTQPGRNWRHWMTEYTHVVSRVRKLDGLLWTAHHELIAQLNAIVYKVQKSASSLEQAIHVAI